MGRCSFPDGAVSDGSMEGMARSTMGFGFPASGVCGFVNVLYCFL